MVPGSHFSTHRLLHGLAFRYGGITGGEHERMNPVPAAVNFLNGRNGQVKDLFPALVALVFKNTDHRKDDAVDADVLPNRCFVLEELIAHLLSDIGHLAEFVQVIVVDVPALQKNGFLDMTVGRVAADDGEHT